MDETLRRRVAALSGRAPIEARRVERGYTPAGRWVLRFADGTSAFAKVGTTPGTAEALRTEAGLQARLRGRFLPVMLGFSDDPHAPLLLLEDLSGWRWPPPWEA